MAAMLSRKSLKTAEFFHKSVPLPVDRLLGSDSVVVLPRNSTLPPELTYFRSQYRNSRHGPRSTRTQIDHDVFEGLPIRHWRKRSINVNTAPEKNINEMKTRNLAWPELDLPRDHHLLSEMSQNLLRAARMPQAKKTIIAPLMEDDKEPGEDEDADGETDMGFVAKRWAVVPKDLEGPEPEFLAKRRKGLPSIHNGAVGAIGGIAQMRKTKIRKIDTNGNSSVLEVLIPVGQPVDGEIFEDEISPTQAPAPGTVVEGVGVVNAEGLVIAGDQGVPANNKRRPPPPKRKAKGPGRGRKKKVAFAGADGKPVSRDIDGTPNIAIRIGEGQAVDSGQGALDHDAMIGDDSMLHDGELEGEESSEEGSEGDEDEEGDREEGELSPSLSPSRSPSKPPLPVIMEPKSGFDIDLPNDTITPEIASLSTTTEAPTEIYAQPIVNPTLENSDDTMDEMLDGPVDEPASNVVNQFTDKPVDEAAPQAAAEYVPLPAEELYDESKAAMSTESPGKALSEQTNPIDTPAGEAVLRPMTEAGEESTAEAAIQSPSDTNVDTVPDFVAEPKLHSTVEAVVEHMSLPSKETVYEPIFEPMAEPKEEPAPETIIEATEEPATEPAVEGVPKALQEPAAEPVAEPISDDTTPPPSMEFIAAPIAEAEEEVEVTPVAKPLAAIVEPKPEPVPEPITTRAIEAFSEPGTEITERKFSFPRPTGSPKAPTPSPPTPIEDHFALKAPYLSPKAPTMSPPTPIDRSMPSSPDIALADQQFQLPPAVDAIQEGNAAPVPNMHQISNSGRISVEAAPRIEPQVNAQIPIEHNALDGLTEPKVVDDSRDKETHEQSVHFSDGEEDLLGSLERSLN